MKVVVLTTSYPRNEDDVAGTFVASAVNGVRALGVDVEVVSPGTFRDFGVAYGGGIVQNLRQKPWRLASVLPFLAAYARAARRASRDADLVHAHWIPSGLAALAAGKPFVLQVWGTDVELARRAPSVVRPLLRRARVVIAASNYLAEQALALGARDLRVVPTPIELPAAVAAPDEPPHVLFVGRLSLEKGILDFLAATDGLPRVIVGDGPLRGRVPEAVGFVPPAGIGALYERAAVVCVPSLREGYGMVAREAMAHARPVVATRVGGLAELDSGGALLVEPGDRAALRSAIETLLADDAARRRCGEAARATAESWSARRAATELRAVYESTLGA